jgi:two-component system response regulator (stage 0 sporulation protein A)
MKELLKLIEDKKIGVYVPTQFGSRFVPLVIKSDVDLEKLFKEEEKLEDDISLSSEEENNELLKRISKVLKDLGMPTHIKGYQYARTGILMVYNDIELLGNVVRGLYGGLAGQYTTTVSRVERAIRHSIDVTWIRGNPLYINKLFGYTVCNNKAKPTSGEFIAKLADELRLGNI